MDREKVLSSPTVSTLCDGGSGSSSTSERRNSSGLAPEIKVPPRADSTGDNGIGPVEKPSDATALVAEPRRRGKLRRAVTAVAVLGFGWFLGLNTQSGEIARATTWLQDSGRHFSSGFTSIQRGLLDSFEHLTAREAPVAENTQPPAQKPNGVAALEGVATTLSTKLDEMRASSEGLARDLGRDVARLRGSMEQSQAELVSKLSKLAERVDHLEQRAAAPSVASIQPEQVVTPSPAAPVPPTMQRSAPVLDAKITPSPPAAEVRRELAVIKQWKVREVLNGMALLQGPGRVVGVSRGQMVPGIGRVESIARQGSRWVVFTSKGIIH
jgi:hypothetical protein